MTTDEFEVWFAKGVTELRAPGGDATELWATDRREGRRQHRDGPRCRPDYLPVVIAAVECACDPAFNLHGVSTSTHFSAPLIVVNGPIRGRTGLNSGFGVFGPGYRANATIGRAMGLLMINVGGLRPGEISMSTFGHPGRYTFCIGENEEAVRGRLFTPAAACRRGVRSHALRRRRAARHLGPRQPNRTCRALLPDASHGEGTNLRDGKEALDRELDAMISNFPSTEELHVVVAGGTAGRFSVAITAGSARATARVRSRAQCNNSIDLTEGARYSVCRFWYKRS